MEIALGPIYRLFIGAIYLFGFRSQIYCMPVNDLMDYPHVCIRIKLRMFVQCTGSSTEGPNSRKSGESRPHTEYASLLNGDDYVRILKIHLILNCYIRGIVILHEDSKH